MNDIELLEKIYYEDKNFDGIDKLYMKAKLQNPKITREIVREWLSKQQTNQMNTVKVGAKEFLPIYAPVTNCFQIDLTFLPKYEKSNSNYSILFTAINTNTRYVYAYPMKNKNDATVLDCLKKMHEKTDIRMITCDKGNEFTNHLFTKYCDEHNIKEYVFVADAHKLGIINRFHRTLKEKLTKYFNSANTVKWIDVIDKIIDNYNHTYHRGIGCAPFEMDDFAEEDYIMEKQKLTNIMNDKVHNFAINELVRVKIAKNKIGDDKFSPKYTDKVFTITKVNKNTLKIIDDQNIEYTTKKSDAKLINDVENKIILTEQNNAIVTNKKDLSFRRSGLDKNDIIIGSKRTPKLTTKLDL